MKKIVVAVRDSAAQAFMSPWIAPTAGMAIRSFRDEVNRAAPDNLLNRHPDDYELWHLCDFEEDTGSFTDNVPTLLSRGKDCIGN